MFFIFPSGPSASFANRQLTSVDSCNWHLPPTNCLSQHAVLVSACRRRRCLRSPPALHPPCCLRRRRHYPQRCHPRHPQPPFAATVSCLCQPTLSLLLPPLLSTRPRHCCPKPSSTATVSCRCQSLLPTPPPTFSTARQPSFSTVPAASVRRLPRLVYHQKGKSRF